MSTLARLRRRPKSWAAYSHPEATEESPPDPVRRWAAVTHALIEEAAVLGRDGRSEHRQDTRDMDRPSDRASMLAGAEK